MDGFDYMFEFNSSRKIKDVRVSKFDYYREYGDEIWENLDQLRWHRIQNRTMKDQLLQVIRSQTDHGQERD